MVQPLNSRKEEKCWQGKAGEEGVGSWDAAQTSEPGARRRPHCALSGAAMVPQTSKAQTHFFSLPRHPSPATRPRNSTRRGKARPPSWSSLTWTKGSLSQFHLPLLIQLTQILNVKWKKKRLWNIKESASESPASKT